MKTKVTIAALVVTAIAIYFIKRSRKEEEVQEPIKKSHHLTEAFSKAKKMKFTE